MDGDKLTREEQIRAISVEAASHLYSGGASYGHRPTLAIDAAKKFESYIKGEDIKENTNG